LKGLLTLFFLLAIPRDLRYPAFMQPAVRYPAFMQPAV